MLSFGFTINPGKLFVTEQHIKVIFTKSRNFGEIEAGLAFTVLDYMVSYFFPD